MSVKTSIKDLGFGRSSSCPSGRRWWVPGLGTHLEGPAHMVHLVHPPLFFVKLDQQGARLRCIHAGGGDDATMYALGVLKWWRVAPRPAFLPSSPSVHLCMWMSLLVALVEFWI